MSNMSSAVEDLTMTVLPSQLRALAQQEHLLKHLSLDEIHCLDNIIEDNCICLSAAIVQVFHENERQWRKQACGILCFITDYYKRSYCFRLYDLRLGQSIYEEIVPSYLQLDQVLDLFYTFDGTKCKVGINFADRVEAEIFREQFRTKQQSRQMKKASKTAVPASKSKPQTTKKSSRWSCSTKTRPVISAPVTQSFAHTVCVTPTESFVKDDSKQQLYQAVLDSMSLSLIEKSYVERMIESNDETLGQSFTQQSLVQCPSPTSFRSRAHENPGPNTCEMFVLVARPAAPSVLTNLHPTKPITSPRSFSKSDRSNLKPTPENVHGNAQRTLEANIQQMILHRPQLTVESNNGDSDFDSSDDDWLD